MNQKDSPASQTPEALINRPFILPCGQEIKNRLMKSAMSEALGTVDNHMTPGLVTLYDRWAGGGAGLLVSGNVMIDRRALGEPYNVAIEDEQDMALLSAWARAGTKNNTQCWIQLNHPGKQVPRGLNTESVAPSAIPFRKELQRFFVTPREMTEAEIEDVLDRFARAASIVKKAGFTGVQIHGAHGYLVSQFLSPHHNRRTDAWGGSAQNRRRFVLEAYRRIRSAVGTSFPVAIKLNSADFQRGGFSETESMEVIAALAAEGVDLVEISGGTYEAPAMSGRKASGIDSEREAYFLEFAKSARKAVKVPLAVTGGFRTAGAMAGALADDSLDMIGMARPLAVDPDYANTILTGRPPTVTIRPITTGIRFLDKTALMEVAWYSRQLRRMAKGKNPRPNESGLVSFIKVMVASTWRTNQTRRLRA
ncbi:NADH:flavin oxidoreductase/NADH oxidase family protein [Desulfosudis oleivorans]|uniref:NADH:flavin oxidoreductase/NADH oxidase n=1 Tax=Desulfosudis oleivorans (strain DSM 6200 / JCM 39069 / Hxd3) TaxID=96561 RepID=A8ZUB5_DESOH|nr:NADH:flavin oxidoreductase/NADH oxidase family protein [Desulfosudis oleivorans]ABW67947.1 NADH:flavin oxidoreductase/NADH oxidase [Desulfosudis oleivorans Hxd3]